MKNRKILTENEIKDLLREYKIPTTDYAVIRDEKDIEKIRLRYPLVLKICSPKFIHKTEVGGVRLGIKNKEELFASCREFQKKFPGEKFLAETMEEQGVEVIIGLVHDPTFGLLIMFGMGGIFTEVLRDVSFRVVPIEKRDAEQMITEIKGRRILEGFRGIKANRNAVIDLLLKVSKLGVELRNSLKELDLNPVFVREQDAVVVDARLVMK
ncbi:MAG: acetate--CoA ligase family protein [Thermoplasmatales archaeon]|nr:acetate--CoA ligase family protein [Thermoplasmatales archaeon]